MRIIFAYLFILFLLFISGGGSSVSAEDSSSGEQISAQLERASRGEISVEQLSEELSSAINSNSISDETLDFNEIFKSFPRLKQTLNKHLLIKLKNVLLEGSQSKAERIKDFISKHYGDDSDAYKTVNRLLSLDQDIAGLRSAKDIESLLLFRGNLSSVLEDDLLEENLSPLLLEKASQLSTGSLEETIKALHFLSEVKPEYVNQRTLVLASTCIKKLEKAASDLPSNLLIKNWPFDAKAVALLIREAEANDPELREILSNLYSFRVLALVSADDISAAENSFIRVLSHRPDPDPRNRELRVAIIDAAKSVRARDFARARLLEISTSEGGISFPLRFKMFIQGYYGKKLKLLILFSFVIAIFGGFFIFLWPKIIRPFAQALRDMRKARDARKRGYERGPRHMDEYSELLSLFGLDDTATEEDIKKAYRNKMKELHPDSAAEVDPEKTQEFVQLKKMHKRILEIRSSRF